MTPRDHKFCKYKLNRFMHYIVLLFPSNETAVDIDRFMFYTYMALETTRHREWKEMGRQNHQIHT